MRVYVTEYSPPRLFRWGAALLLSIVELDVVSMASNWFQTISKNTLHHCLCLLACACLAMSSRQFNFCNGCERHFDHRTLYSQLLQRPTRFSFPYNELLSYYICFIFAYIKYTRTYIRTYIIYKYISVASVYDYRIISIICVSCISQHKCWFNDKLTY